MEKEIILSKCTVFMFCIKCVECCIVDICFQKFVSVSGYICSSKLIPVSQYIGTVLVCLLGVACLRGELFIFTWNIFEFRSNQSYIHPIMQCNKQNTAQEEAVAVTNIMCLCFCWVVARLGSLEKPRISPVHHHSGGDQEEPHKQQQGEVMILS